MQGEDRAMLFGFTLGAACGLCFGVMAIGTHIHWQAVERGYAEYESKSGKWQWVERQPARKSRDFLEAESVQPNFQGLE